MIILLILMFIAGYLIGKSGRFHVYIDGHLYPDAEVERFIVYRRGIGFLNDLFGVDYSNTVLTPVFRPLINFQKRDGILALAVRTGDFSEVMVMLSYRFPFIKVRSESNIYHVRSIDE